MEGALTTDMEGDPGPESGWFGFFFVGGARWRRNRNFQVKRSWCFYFILTGNARRPHDRRSGHSAVMAVKAAQGKVHSKIFTQLERPGLLGNLGRYNGCCIGADTLLSVGQSDLHGRCYLCWLLVVCY